MAITGLTGRWWRAAVVVGAALAAAGCSSSAPPAEPAANAAAPTASGSLADWQDAVCRAGDEGDGASGTRHTVSGTVCVPHDGDGIVNFDHFESDASMDSVLSWTPSPHVATTVVDGKPLAIWTPSGEVSDLAPLQGFGFQLASYQSAPLARPGTDLPASVPGTDVVTLPANPYGYVVVQTPGGDTECIVEATFVGCQTDGEQWQQHADGSGPYHGVRINTDGTGSWVDGNLGAAPPTTLGQQTYRAMGWTIESAPSGLRFTNDATGHGALVSIERVQPF